MRSFPARLVFLVLCSIVAGSPKADAQVATARYSASPVDAKLRDIMVEGLRALLHTRVNAGLQLTSALPLSASEIPELLKRDQLDVAILHTTTLPVVARERAQVFNHAIGFASIDELRKALLSEVGASVLGALPEDNLVGLGFLSTGLSRIASKQQISSLDDLRGQKIVVPNLGTTREVIARLGGNPTSVASGEVYTALSSGVVDGAELTPGLGLTQQGYHEVFRSVVDQPFRPQVFVVVVRSRFWRDLPYAAQAALSDAVAELAERLDEFSLQSEVAFFNDVRSRGLRLVTPSAEEASRARNSSFAVWSEQASAPVRDYLVRAAFAGARQPSFQAASSGTVDVNVMFATDRKDEGGTGGVTSFGSRRAINQLTLAQASVTIPKVAPLSTDLTKTAKFGPFSRFADSSAFVAVAKQKLASTNTSRVLVHVHGYYNTLTDVLPRVAAFDYEAAFNGIVILYSWPSDGRALSYGYDHDSIEVSLQNFDKFMGILETIVDRSKISVLLHSMGSRLWIDYIEKIKDRSGARRKYAHVAFAASDVAMDRFQQLADDIVSFAQDVTVYSAENDNTLWLAEKLHAGDNRLGRPAPGKIFVHSPIQSIDATGVDASTASWRHSYVFNTPGGFRDVKLLLTQGLLAPRTGLVKRTRNTDTYWYLTP